MKKVFLPLLFLTLPLSAQPNHFKSIEYLDRLKEIISDTKELIKAHPYISLTIGVATTAAIYWYSHREDEEDCSIEAFYQRGAPMENGELRKPGWYTPPHKKSPDASPDTSPRSSVASLRDYTGDFPKADPLTYNSKSTLHPTEFRHK